ncbi:MAG: T9SS type A sorting domain-containing protein [Burkholderiales bacterium]|nr:T9SS type A sorting domain-containing protein [Bacteroidia bacterium]
MKKIITLLFVSLLVLPHLNAVSQTNRRNIKKSIPYRANYQRVATASSASHMLELKEGMIHSWGENTYGQLGDGTNTNSSIPVAADPDTKWVSAATGGFHSLGIKTDGTLWTWGLNSNGQLGDGTNTNRNAPVQIGVDDKWIGIVAGNMHSLGLKSDGTLWAWGDNTNGQLGDGTTTNRNNPVQIGTDFKWVTISAGSSHNICVKSDGTLWAWGDNSFGQLGDGTITQRNSPTQIGTDNKWVSVSSGLHHSLAIKVTGTLFAWGENNFGQLGDGTTTNQTAPLQIGAEVKWVSINAGSIHSLALKADGTLWSWGDNSYGELGDGTVVQQNSPVQIGTDNSWVTFATGLGYSVALKSNGTLHTWGKNTSGQIGDGTTLQKNLPTQVAFDFTEYVNVSTGAYHTFIVKSDGTLLAWGGGGYGRLGDGVTSSLRTIPFQIGADTKWVSVLAGGSGSIGIKADGTLWTWGYNYNGQLGDGTTSDRNTPGQIGVDHDWVSVSLGSSHCLALKADGTLWAWGANYYGEVGDGTNVDRYSPVQVGTDTKWMSVTAGINHSFGIKSDGTLWAWGDNQYGALGDGSNTVRYNPVQIGVDNKWVSIASNLYHTVALKSNGTLWTWGNNSNGQLGSSTTVNRNSPGQVGTDNHWISVTAGLLHSVALKSNGTDWEWGYNTDGQLGDGTVAQKTFPIMIGTDNTWVQTSAGRAQSFGLKSQRLIYCATGDNAFGQLGDGTLTDKTIFTCNTGACFAPALPITSNLTICSGASATLSASGVGNIGWYSASTSGTYLGGGVNYATPVLTVNTTYYVQDSTCSGSTTRKAVVVTVNPMPNVSVVASSTNVCLGNEITLTAFGTGTYSWSGGVTNGIAFSPSVTTTFTVISSIGACVDTASVLIAVNSNSLPTVTANASSVIICNGSTVVLTGGGATTYLWTGGITDGIAFTPTSTSTYTVTGIDGSSCYNTAIITLSVNPLPVVNANASSITVCPGSSITLSGGGALSYTWTGGVTDGNAFTPTSTVAYTVTGTDVNGCVDSDFVVVTVFPVSAFSQSLVVCTGGSVTVGTNTYSTSGTYTDILTSFRGCDSTVTTNVSVAAPINVNTSLNGITITANQAGAAYQWLNCNTGYTVIPSETNQSYAPTSNGNYAVSVTINACSDTSSCVNVISVGLIENTINHSFHVYPNPSKGNFIIQSDVEGDYSIVNALGQTIQVFKLNTANNYIFKVDGMSIGIYFIIGFNDKIIIKQKVLVE